MCMQPLIVLAPAPLARPLVSMRAHFASLKDPRVDRTKAHALLDILVIAICAVIGGANDWEAVAEFGRSKLAWFTTFLALPNGIPSHDTFWRVFRALDAEQFQTCFLNWMRAVSPLLGGQVAIDGKQLRRSHDRGAGQAAIRLCRGERLGDGPSARAGATQGGGEVQRDHRHPGTAAGA